MADKPITPLERLQEIVDSYKKLITVAQIEDFRKTLLPEELEALDAYIEDLKTVTPPPRPTQQTQKPLTQAEWQAKKRAEEEAALKKAEPAKQRAAPKAPAPEKPPIQPTIKPELIIERTHYPKWWNDEGMAKISLTSPGSSFIITAREDLSLYIASIVFTVSGECDIVFTFGSMGASGPMNFGGTDEPRGIVIAMGNSPVPCGSGSLMITATSSESVTIGGFVGYFLWKKPKK